MRAFKTLSPPALLLAALFASPAFAGSSPGDPAQPLCGEGKHPKGEGDAPPKAWAEPLCGEGKHPKGEGDAPPKS